MPPFFLEQITTRNPSRNSKKLEELLNWLLLYEVNLCLDEICSKSIYRRNQFRKQAKLGKPYLNRTSVIDKYFLSSWSRWAEMFNPCFTEKLFTTFLSLFMKFFATSLSALVCLLGIPAIYQVSTTPGIFYVWLLCTELTKQQSLPAWLSLQVCSLAFQQSLLTDFVSAYNDYPYSSQNKEKV